MAQEESVERSRVVLELPLDVELAIRLRVAKTKTKPWEVVSAAIEKAYEDDIAEARRELARQRKQPTRK